MTWRPVSCLAVSALIHLCALLIPFAIMTFPFQGVFPPEDAISVNLVGSSVLKTDSGEVKMPAVSKEEKDVNNDAADKPQDTAGPEEPQTEAGISFEADRKVSTSYLERLKTKIFLVWKYPDEAIDKGQHGSVSIVFVLNTNGELTSIRVLKGSGSGILDAATIAAVRQANPFGPFPKDIGDKPLKITGKFLYVLD